MTHYTLLWTHSFGKSRVGIYMAALLFDRPTSLSFQLSTLSDKQFLRCAVYIMHLFKVIAPLAIALTAPAMVSAGPLAYATCQSGMHLSYTRLCMDLSEWFLATRL
jgi:hypothetical protein